MFESKKDVLHKQQTKSSDEDSFLSFFASLHVDRLLFLCSSWLSFCITHISLYSLFFSRIIIHWLSIGFWSFFVQNNLQNIVTLLWRQERCVRCMVINQKHGNILQYKESKCLDDHVELVSFRDAKRLKMEVRLVLNSCSCLSYLGLSCLDSHSQLFSKTFTEKPSWCLFGDQWRCLPLLFI